MNETELAFTPATEQARLVREKHVSPLELVDMCYSRIERLNPALSAFTTLDKDRARAAARQAESAVMLGNALGPLHGVPVGIKENEITEGIETTWGSLWMKGHVPKEDSVVVERLKAAGAIVLGKTNMPDWGVMIHMINRLGEPTRNPWDTAHTSGGSSSGSAAGVAAGLCSLASGTDGGGSIRAPASFCGVFGIRPTLGRVPRYTGVSPSYIVNQLSQPGPIARSVGDAAAMLGVIAGYDSRDPDASRLPVPDYVAALGRDVAGLRIAYSPVLGYVDVDPEIAALVRAAAEVMRDLGATIEKVDPGFNDPAETFRRQWARRSPSVNFWMLSKRAINWAKRCRSSTKHTTCCSHRRCPFLLSRQAKRSLARTASRDGRFGLRLRSRSTLPSNLSLQHHAVSRVKDCPPVSKSLAQSMPMRWSCVPRVPTSPLVHSGCRTNRTCNIDGLER